MFELSNSHLHVEIVYLVVSCQCVDKVLPRSRHILMSGSKKFSLLMKQSTSSRSALSIQRFSCPLCNQLNSFFGVQELQVHFEGMVRETVTAKDSHSDLVFAGDCEHFAGGRPLLVRAWPMPNCSTEKLHLREAATGCRDMWEFVSSSSCVKSTVGANLAPLVSIFCVGIGHVGLMTCECWCNVILPNAYREFLRSGKYPNVPTRNQRGAEKDRSWQRKL